MTLYERSVMQELQELLEDEFNELLQAYIHDVLSKVAEIEQLKITEDLQGIRHVAHSLKGSSINLGIEGFSQQCSEMEIHAKNGNQEALTMVMETFRDNAQALVQSLEADFL